MDYLATAKAAKDRLVRLDREREALLKIIEGAEALAAFGATHEPTPSHSPPSQSRARVRVPRPGGAMEDTRREVAQALTARNAPMQTRELLLVLLGKGVEVGGKDSVATLSARLSNSDEFQLHKGHGWWFTGKPLPGFEFEEAEENTVEGAPSASPIAQGREAAPGGGT